jgi:hypothetical protein
MELVSAWAQQNRLTLGQVKVADDSNEITAVPELWRLIEIKGGLVTLDALNPQNEIARADAGARGRVGVGAQRASPQVTGAGG